MRLTDHRDVLDVAVAAQRVLDLAREHVEARDDHDVLGAIDERQPAVGVGDRDVAGVQPTVDEHRGGRRGVVPITRRTRSTPHDDLTGVAVEDRFAVVVEQPHLDARERRADRAGPGLVVDRGRGHDRRRLGEPVAVVHVDAEALVHRGRGLRSERRRARDAQAHRPRTRRRAPLRRVPSRRRRSRGRPRPR